ncbi:hypothetical protein CANARDRAFT_187342, partial [[Candida] arabinofermentans NRRL YB-2248]
MGANTCDGDVYIHNLATFIKSHERQLANALIAYKKSNSKSTDKASTQQQAQQAAKPVRLSLSLHHLYFLLGKFQDLGMAVGPMNIRLDNIDTESSNNYVSFLSEFQRNKALSSSDNQSIHSMSSVKSVMSSVSALWNTLGSSGNKGENIIADLKYLHSAFTKLPCLRLANDPNAKLIEGHEEYPFDTSTPVQVFKNLSVLEISELDPKEVYGWHILSENIRFLVIKKTNITDPVEVLVDLVSEDANRRGSMYSNSYSSSPYHHYMSTSVPDSSSPPSSYYSSRLIHEEKPSVSVASSRRQYNYYQHQRRSQRSDSNLSDNRYTQNADITTGNSLHDNVPNITSLSSSNPSNTTIQPFSSLSSSVTTVSNVKSLKSQEESHAEHWRGLKHLSFTENKISSISDWSFENLDNLSSLDLSHNRLIEIPAGALSKLNNLKSLNLSFNRLVDTQGFPRNLSKLTILNLRGNSLMSLESIDNLRSLEKMDLRQNRIASINELKPLLLANDERVRLITLYLVGNPIASNRGYRIELFNLFNGVDYSNCLRIDGSRPGIFESRLLLDPKSAQLKLNKFLDASIISKMTASVSSMNLAQRKSSLTQSPTLNNFFDQISNPAPVVGTATNTTATTTTTTTANNSSNTIISNLSTPIPPSPSRQQPSGQFEAESLMASPSTSIITPAHDENSLPIKQQQQQHSRNNITNPINKITLAAPALPVITQATTITTTV